MKANIVSLYDELWRTGKKVICFLLPIKQYDDKVADKNIVNEINNFHRELITKYGFYLIDVDLELEGYKQDVVSTKYIQPDALHCLDSFMYMLGNSIRSFIHSQNITSFQKSRIADSRFYNVDLIGEDKSNSKFSRSLRTINEEINCSEVGDLVGIETWSDGNSRLQFKVNGKSYIKCFNSNLSFNEIQSFSSGKFIVKDCSEKDLKPTEPSVNVVMTKNFDCFVRVSSLLFFKNTVPLINQCNNFTSYSLNNLIPNVAPFIGSVERLINKKVLYHFNNKDVDILRDVAVSLEVENVNFSYHLMRIANIFRPSGPFIKLKLDEYKQRMKN